MPDYPVKADVDTMLRANDKAGIRSAIGVGTTDAPTFLAQTLTGQSLTGTQATSLVDLATTWNTPGILQAAIKLNVTDTTSNASSSLMDLQASGVSKVRIGKNGGIALNTGGDGFNGLFGTGIVSTNLYLLGQSSANGLTVLSMSGPSLIGWANSPAYNAMNLILARDADGILAQRNGTNAQTFRVYNSTDAFPATNYDRSVFGFTSNVLRIGTENGGTYTTARPIEFVTGGNVRLTIGASGTAIFSNAVRLDSFFYIGAANGVSLQSSSSATGVLLLQNGATNNFDRIQLGGTTDAFPAIARDGAGIKITGAAAGSTSWIKVPAVAVSALPSAATAGVGARSFVNDALAPTFGSAVTGGGAVTVPVYSTGSAWNVG